jgi:hypothetical protein
MTLVSDQQAPRLPVAASQTHEPLPVRGTFRRASNGEPLELPLAAWEYPVLADCSACETPVRKKDAILGVWEHAE